MGNKGKTSQIDAKGDGGRGHSKMKSKGTKGGEGGRSAEYSVQGKGYRCKKESSNEGAVLNRNGGRGKDVGKKSGSTRGRSAQDGSKGGLNVCERSNSPFGGGDPLKKSYRLGGGGDRKRKAQERLWPAGWGWRKKGDVKNENSVIEKRKRTLIITGEKVKYKG